MHGSSHPWEPESASEASHNLVAQETHLLGHPRSDRAPSGHNGLLVEEGRLPVASPGQTSGLYGVGEGEGCVHTDQSEIIVEAVVGVPEGHEHDSAECHSLQLGIVRVPDVGTASHRNTGGVPVVLEGGGMLISL